MEINIGLIGAGYMGKLHAVALNAAAIGREPCRRNRNGTGSASLRASQSGGF
ncbi:hypothetical protein PsW64_03154 [Pseudovibrio sp. W64]|nr:hypothetical protein PsW64_03154 [Pseudovibrio sp. W64]